MFKYTLIIRCFLECIAVEETAVEKWVALTRRVAQVTRCPTNKKENNKNALVRHIYDLFMIAQENKLGDNFVSLAKEVVHEDKNKYKMQHAEYFSNPIDEINYSLKLLKGSEFKNHYENLIEAFVYEESPPKYADALKLVEKISSQVVHILSSD